MYSLCVICAVLQEESSIKPEEQSPRSRFGQNTEDLTNASKQVRLTRIDMLECLCFCFSMQVNVLFLITFHEVITVCHTQIPQKPVRRKYHPDSQNLEPVPPPAVQFPPPTKSTQKSVKYLPL